MNLKERGEKIKKEIPIAFLAMQKKETPWYTKAFAVFTIGYALSPIDLIPDFIPILGYLDDLILLPLLVAATFRLIPAEIKEQCRIEAEQLWKEGRPKKWYYAIPIVLIWLIIITLIIKALV